jgi:hypothetical protein
VVSHCDGNCKVRADVSVVLIAPTVQSSAWLMEADRRCGQLLGVCMYVNFLNAEFSYIPASCFLSPEIEVFVSEFF